MRLVLLIALGLPAAPGRALDLPLPANAELTREVVREADSYMLPVGPFSGGSIETRRIEGRIVQQAWRMVVPGLTTLQVLAPLRDGLPQAGYKLLYECARQECGGFDFRFNTDVLPAPDMFVDLFDFRFLAARKAGDNGQEEHVSVLASRAGATGYVQIIHVVSGGTHPALRPAGEAARMPLAPASLADTLLASGHVILDDLVFESGSAALGPGPYDSLAQLAAYLNGNAARRVALVGHTDASGGPEPNIDLSRRRAAAVLERLVVAHDVARAQLEAGGMGYLAPIASNLTPGGRDVNRRVEAVLLAAE